MENKGTSSGIKTKLNKLRSIDKGITVRSLVDKIGYLFLILAGLCYLLQIKEAINMISFDFKNIGEEFNQSLGYKYGVSSNDYGLKRNDYIDFDYVIRTDDGGGDCKISGRYTRDGLEYVDASGDDDCNNLNYEK